MAGVIVNWRAAELTARAVESLAPQTDCTVIVDNGSDDGSAAMLRERFAANEKVRVVALPENLGFGGGVNAGIASVRGEADAIVLLNNDAVARAGFVDALVAQLDDPRVGAVTAQLRLSGRWRPTTTPGAGLVAHDGSRWEQAPDGVELLNSTGNELDARGNGRDRDWLTPVGAESPTAAVFGFCGGASLLRTDALDEVGTFDTSLFMYYEDTELSLRLRKAGWSVRYAGDAVAIHDHASSSGTTSSRFIRWNARNRIAVAAMHAPPRVVAGVLARTVLRVPRALLRPAAADEARAVLLALGDICQRAGALVARRRELRQGVFSRSP